MKSTAKAMYKMNKAVDVPAITNVREDLLPDDFSDSGFFNLHPKYLEQVFNRILENPDELERRAQISRKYILKCHDNEKILNRMIQIYDSLFEKKEVLLRGQYGENPNI